MLDHMVPGTWLLNYVEFITLGKIRTGFLIMYANFGEYSKLTCSMNVYGNESHFLYDFQDTG